MTATLLPSSATPTLAGAPKKLFRIGEVMAHTGLSRQTLHNYTMLGLIQPAGRTPAGHRLYGEETFARLERVKALRDRHTLLEIRALLDAEDGSDAPR